jgi:hypothetical protein
LPPSISVQDLLLVAIESFDSTSHQLKGVVSWTEQGEQRFLLTEANAEAAVTAAPWIILRLGQPKPICNHPLSISRTCEANKIMIANIQLNCPKICLNFGANSVMFLAPDDKEEKLLVRSIYVCLKPVKEDTDLTVDWFSVELFKLIIKEALTCEEMVFTLTEPHSIESNSAPYCLDVGGYCNWNMIHATNLN